MRRVPVVDIVSPRPNLDESKQLRISDDDIDKIFNSNCGPFEEVKRESVQKPATKPISLESNKKLDVKQQESKQVSAHSKVIDISMNTSDKLAKATSKENLKSKDLDSNKKLVDRPVPLVSQEVKVKDFQYDVKASKMTGETDKPCNKSEAQVKETSTTSMEVWNSLLS